MRHYRVCLYLCLAILLLINKYEVMAQIHSNEKIDSLRKEALNYFKNNNFSNALAYQSDILTLIANLYSETSHEYGEALRDYALFLSECGKIEEAIVSIEQAITIFDSALTKPNIEGELSRLDLASYHSSLSHYDIALQTGIDALQTLEKLDSVPPESYAIAIAKVSRFYEDCGNHEQALILGIKALTLIENIFGNNSERYAQMLDQLSYIYYERGDLQNAITYCQKACDVFSNIPYSPFYINALNDLAAYYCDYGEISKAIELGQMACVSAKNIYGENNIFYINTINNLARYYSANNDVDKAIEQSNYALKLCNIIGLNNNISYARSLGHLANFYSQKRDFSTAIQLAEQSKPIFKQIFGHDTPGYVSCLRDLARYYYGNTDYVNSINYIDSANSLIQDIVLRAFSYMPSHERFLYWSWYKDWFYHEIPNFCMAIRSDQMYRIAYNSILFSKGILLNTDVEEQRISHESDGDISIKLYEELQKTRNRLDQLSYDGTIETEKKRDSLMQAIVIHTNQLSETSNVFSNYLKKQGIKWENITTALKKNEIAIEFVKVNNETDCYYIALTLKKDYDSPHMVELFTESQLRDVDVKDYYRNEKLFNIIWKPLKNELKGVKNIYFSPDGCMHNIGIENLPMPDGQLMFEKYILYRVSSTRELVLREDLTTVEHAALFGGLDYDYYPTREKGNISFGNTQSEINENLYRSISNRGLFSSLPATSTEVKTISNLLAQNNVSCEVYIDQCGTEDSFKKLSGQGVNVLHLATHGEYIPMNMGDSDDALNKLAFNYEITQEDLALTRSYIVLTGGNRVADPEYKKTILGDDGLLTSHEVSKMDLSEAKLVVLSACKTAQGDMSDDGVIGLQRGFKKAGVNAIIMSLWEVADTETQYLMTRFYHYYTKGKPTNISFCKAKKDLKTQYGTSGIRPYWASFIILDALD